MSKAETTVMREMVDMSTVPPSYEETISGALNPTNAPPRYKREFDRRPAHQAAVPPHIARFNLAADRKAKLDATNLMMYIKMEMKNGLITPGLLEMDRVAYEAMIAAANTWASERTSPIKGTVLHNVSAGDTIQGLSLKYGTTPSAIRALNQLGINGAIFGRQTIMVPVGYTDFVEPQEGSADGDSDAPTNPTMVEFQIFVKQAIVTTFQFKTQCTEEESGIVCNLNDFHLARALTEYKADQKWQATPAAKTHSGSLSEFLSRK